MVFQKLSGSEMIAQLLPEKKQAPLEGLYLGQGLVGLSAKLGRSLVISDFLMDKNGVVAKTDPQGIFQVPPELKNPYDWRLFQELMSQADVIISSSAYVRGLQVLGRNAQNILSQFEPGGKFEQLGERRLHTGYTKRSPDLAIVSRGLDFTLPEKALASGRRITVLTTDSMVDSEKAKALTASGAVVVGCGGSGVDGNRMVDWLSAQPGYRIIMMSAGPAILELLLEANRLDLIYITEVQCEIPSDGHASFRTVLPEGQKVSGLAGFSLAHKYLQDNVATENGSLVSQFFLRYDKKGLLADGS